MMRKQRINLVPKQLRIALSINFRKLMVVWVLLVMVAFLIIHVVQTAYVLKYKNQIARQNIESQLLAQQKRELDEEITNFSKKLPRWDQLEEMNRMIKRILSNYILPSALLRELSLMMPPDVWVTQLSLTTPAKEAKDKKTSHPGRWLVIEGVALYEEGVAEVLSNFESHPWFEEVKLDFAEREENRYQQEVFNFLIRGKLEEGTHEG